MYKVVIVDDEPIILEGLKQMVDWKKFDCEVVGTATSVIAGMTLVNDLKPDILFSDIRMASLSGINMISALKADHPDLEITILTGYRDFDYAQQAVRLGVRRYLLKPSKMEDIHEAIQAMVEALKSKKTEDEELLDDENGGVEGNFIVKNAIAYMELHYSEKLSLSLVAEHVFVSPWHLSKLLNAQGSGFSEILNGIRIKKAKEFMRDPALRIGDIAEQVGFSDMAHFSRVFKKSTGMSAKEYRRKI